MWWVVFAVAAFMTQHTNVAFRATFFWWLSVALTVLLTIVTTFSLWLWRRVREETFKRQVQNGLQSLDVLLREMLEPGQRRTSPANRRSHGVRTALHLCNEILRAKQKRLSYLHFEKNTRRFRMTAHIGVPDETRIRAERELSEDNGYAGHALRHPGEVWYLPDCDSPDARRQGYVDLGPECEQRSLVCIGVCVNGSAVGVICADSSTRKAFSEQDLAALKAFAAHLGIFYRSLPRS